MHATCHSVAGGSARGDEPIGGLPPAPARAAIAGPGGGLRRICRALVRSGLRTVGLPDGAAAR